jgi:hypothetical protein
MADLLTAAMCVYMITPFRCGQPARLCTAEEGGTGSVSQDRVRARSVGCMNNRSEEREFLISRRGKVTPERVGLAAHPGTRRVPGLRRSEVAQFAGVSVEYYTQLERGNLGGGRVRRAGGRPASGRRGSTRQRRRRGGACPARAGIDRLARAAKIRPGFALGTAWSSPPPPVAWAR